MAKKTKCTPELIERMKENVKLGFTYSALSLSLGISEDTFYSWIRKGRDEQLQPYVSFYAALREAEAELLAECLQQLKLSMKMGNVESAKFMLERRFNNMGYGKSSQIDMKSQNINVTASVPASHEDNEKIRQEILSRLTPKDKPY